MAMSTTDFVLPDLQIEVELSGHLTLLGKPLWDWRVHQLCDGRWVSPKVPYFVKTQGPRYGVKGKEKAFQKARKAAAEVCKYLAEKHEKDMKIAASVEQERVTCGGVQ